MITKRIERINAKKMLKTFGLYFVLVLASLYILLPFYVILITSLKSGAEANYVSFTWWPKNGFHFENYLTVLTDETPGITLFQSFINTIWMSLIPTLASVFISALSAYGFAKLNFIFKKQLFNILLMSMMIPGCITLTTSYIIFDMIGWVDTPLPLIIPSCFGSIGILFFLKQYIAGIPDSLIDAATIDGMGKFSIFFAIIVPLSTPALIAQGILTFIGKYNNYLGALIYLQSPEWYTLQIALRFYSGIYSSNMSIIATASMISIIPLLIIYAFAQNFIIKGISMSTGLKG